MASAASPRNCTPLRSGVSVLRGLSTKTGEDYMKRGLLVLGLLLAGGTADARTVTIRIGADFSSLDPAKTLTTDGYQMDSVLYDRLLAISADGKLGPALATSWEGSADSATFKVRNDAVCADGTKLTPGMIAASLTRMNAPDTHAPYAYRSTGSAGYSVVGDDA